MRPKLGLASWQRSTQANAADEKSLELRIDHLQKEEEEEFDKTRSDKRLTNQVEKSVCVCVCWDFESG